MKFFWAKGYSDYHPEKPGGRAEGGHANAARSTHQSSVMNALAFVQV